MAYATPHPGVPFGQPASFTNGVQASGDQCGIGFVNFVKFLMIF